MGGGEANTGAKLGMMSAPWKRRRGEDPDAYFGRIFDLHLSFVESGDLANALALWDEYIPHHFRAVVGRGDGRSHQFALPSIISSFMPKSGGTFLHNRLLVDAGYGEFWWGLTHPKSGSDVLASAPGLAAYLLGGFSCHTHFLPHPQPMRVIGAMSSQPIWVHIRNPVDCVVSAYHHYLGHAQGRGAVLEARRDIGEAEALRFDLDLSNVECFARQNIVFFIMWLNEWVKFDQMQPGAVRFSFFDELRDVRRLLNHLITDFGGRASVSSITTDLDADRKRTENEDRHALPAHVAAELRDVVAKSLAGFVHLDRLIG